MTHPTQALLERLEATAATLANHDYSTDAVMDAISEIRRLEAENERFERALRIEVWNSGAGGTDQDARLRHVESRIAAIRGETE